MESPPATSAKEKWLLGRLTLTRKLFGFLRLRRHELFDEVFQKELESMYRTTGAGAEPHAPAQMCMVLLLQGYLHISDAEAVELSVVDARWQMVLDCFGAEKPPFSQGSLYQFRGRLIAADMDRRLLERTVELARKTKEFDWKKLPKDLRIAVDSRPFEGAGRVEDTFNLLGHAARKLVECAAVLLEEPVETICHRAGIPLLLGPSLKASLDLNWSEPDAKVAAMEKLSDQLTSLVSWVEKRRLENAEPLRPLLQTLARIQKQDLEQTPQGVRVRQGVAEDRQVSIEDPQMRHGRKSRTKRFNGYKQHIAMDVDTGLVRACAVTPANRPEEEATPSLRTDLDRQKRVVGELQIDRAYVNSTLVADVRAGGGEILAKPWAARNSDPTLFRKSAFKFDMRAMTITCPAGEVEYFEQGQVVEFDPEMCGPCRLRSRCTHSASGRGRTVHVGEDERLQQRLRKLQGTHAGRERLRERVGIEHCLAHVAARQGRRARYFGLRKNLFDLRRVAAIGNLETIHRTAAQPKLAA